MRLILPKIYPIIDTTYVLPSDVNKVALSLIKGGAGIIQLRSKNLNPKETYETANNLRELLIKEQVTFIINDRPDIAKICESDGIHIGQEDLPIEVVRKILGPEKIIGMSTHNIKEAEKAQAEGADYISLGPIFVTKTKKNAREVRGLKLLKEITSKIDIPLVAIGGINEENLKDVLKNGALSCAVISDILLADNIEEKIKKLIEISK